MMTSERYENGYSLITSSKLSWGRVDDSNSQTVYEGTRAGAKRWLADRGLLSLSRGATRAERLARRR